MDVITPLIAAKICKSFAILPLDLHSFDDSFTEEFVDKTEQYLFKEKTGLGSYLFGRYNIEKYFNSFLVNYGFSDLSADPAIEKIGDQNYLELCGKQTTFPYIEHYNPFPDAVIKHINGKQYLVYFFEPKHISSNTTIYDDTFNLIHTMLLWAISQMCDVNNKYNNNFIFITTSEYIFNEISNPNNYLSNFKTNKGTDIYLGICRANRKYKCIKNKKK